MKAQQVGHRLVSLPAMEVRIGFKKSHCVMSVPLRGSMASFEGGLAVPSFGMTSRFGGEVCRALCPLCRFSCVVHPTVEAFDSSAR